MVASLCVTEDMCWFSVCWGHGTDVSRTGMCTDGGGLRLSGPSSGNNNSVRVVVCCLLRIVKVSVKDKNYIWMSV